jgi:hypothetical protein
MLKRSDAIDPWLYARCREVEKNSDGYLDLWARFHYKSTIVTFAGIIQEILKNPEITIGIFSYNNALATDFLTQIKREFEGNEELYFAFPEIFFENPKKSATLWSTEKGIVVKRKSNPRESTVSAWGLVDSQPIGRHFMLRVYDDIITQTSVTSQTMIDKVTENWELSLSLGDGKINRQWYVGTRYNASDTYQEILDREYLIPRIFPATDDGTKEGKPVFMEQHAWEELLKGTSDFVLACQQLLNPLAGKQQEFSVDWIRRWEVRPKNLNVYITVDPASGKKSANCNTAMIVIGVDASRNMYLLDGMCHKMDLNARWANLKKLRYKWINALGVQTVTVGYERYSMQADIEHFEAMMDIEGKHFPIEEVNWVGGGSNAKDDRIRRLIPDHKNWRFFYPEVEKKTGKMQTALSNGQNSLVAKPIRRLDDEGKVYELTDWFIKHEYTKFPHSAQHKDMLDAMSRIYDLDIVPPMEYNTSKLAPWDFMETSPSYTSDGQCLEPEVG